MSTNELSDLSIFDDNWEKENIRSNWMDFKKILLTNDIDCFYHVTDESNIESIKKEGLCSWEYCEKNNIKINCYGSNILSRELDIGKGLSNYVRLSVFKENPLVFRFIKEQRIPDPCILKIDPRVIYLKTTKISNINATDHNVTVGGNISDFKNINFEISNKNGYSNKGNEFKLLQAEILVRTWVPCKFINNLKLYAQS